MKVPCDNGCGRMIRKKSPGIEFCADCRRQGRRARIDRQLLKRKGQPKTPTHLKTLGTSSPRAVAKILRTTEKNIWRLERQALEKLKRNKGVEVLREYWLAYLEGGRSRPAPPVDAGQQLLEYQLQVSEFYETYDLLVGEGREAEAVECLGMINKCQDLIAREMGLTEIPEEKC